MSPYINKLLTKNRLFFILFILVLVTLGIIMISNHNDIDVRPEGDGIILDYSSSAALTNSEDLFNTIGSLETYDYLREDIYTFGKENYKPYQIEPSKTIGFAVAKGSVKKNGSDVFFEGEYGSSSSKIKISIKLLKNFRIKTSITDTVLGTNIDSKLPSNSDLNQLIGNLPYTADKYTVAFSDEYSKIVIRLQENTAEIQSEALDYVRSVVGDDFIKDKNISIFYPYVDPISGRAEQRRSYITDPFSEDADREED